MKKNYKNIEDKLLPEHRPVTPVTAIWPEVKVGKLLHIELKQAKSKNINKPST